MGLQPQGLNPSLRNLTTSVGAIPTSAVMQVKMDEGSGTTVADSIGTTDGSFKGGPQWVSDTSFTGSYKVALDGADDYISFPMDDSTIGLGADWSMGITIDVGTALPDGVVVWNADLSSNNVDTFGIGVANGRLAFGLYNGGWTSVYHTQPSAPYTIRLLSRYDSSADDLDLQLDGTNPDGSGEDPTAITGGGKGYHVGANSKNANHSEITVDHLIEYDSYLSDSEVQQDYNNQPWS